MPRVSRSDPTTHKNVTVVASSGGSYFEDFDVGVVAIALGLSLGFFQVVGVDSELANGARLFFTLSFEFVHYDKHLLHRCSVCFVHSLDKSIPSTAEGHQLRRLRANFSQADLTVNYVLLSPLSTRMGGRQVMVTCLLPLLLWVLVAFADSVRYYGCSLKLGGGVCRDNPV